MLKEIDFLVRYPFLEAIRSSGSALLDLLNEVCSLDFPPNSGWVPAIQDAIADMTGALAAESLPKLDEALQSEFQEAVRLTQHSFDHGEGWLLDARSLLISALERLETQIESFAKHAFGQWGGHFFLLCVSTLPPDYFDPNSYAAGARPRRPAYERDHCWLSWKLNQGMGPARIRDRWNAMSEEDRCAICSEAPDKIGWSEDGREVVKKGLRKAILEAGAAELKGGS